MRSRKLLSFVLTAAMVASFAAIAAPAAQAQIQNGGSTNAQMFNPDNAARTGPLCANGTQPQGNGSNGANAGNCLGTQGQGNNTAPASAAGPLTQDLSNKPDGQDSQAHITSVGTGDVTQANYYYCANNQFPGTGAQVPPNGTNNGTFLNPSNPNNTNQGGPPAGCTLIGTDNTGTIAGRDNDERAFDFLWTVPGSAPRVVEIVALHCVGAPTANEPGNNCVENLQNNVNLDSNSQDTSGELNTWCIGNTSDPNNPSGACPTGANVNNFTVGFDQTVAAPLKHPTVIPVPSDVNQHYIFTATGSSDIQVMTACIDDTSGGPGTDPIAGGDATVAPNECTFLRTATSGTTTANGGRNFTFDFGSSLTFPPGGETGLYIYNTSGGSGACRTDGTTNDGPGTAGVTGNGCLLDSHYLVFETPRPTSVVASWEASNSNPGATNSSTTPTNAGCANPTTSATDNAGESEDAVACVVDQFGRPFNLSAGQFNWESRGVGTILECAPGTNPGGGGTQPGNSSPAPTNSGVPNSPVPSPTAGYPNQTCSTPTNSNGVSSARVRTNAPGTQTLIGCADSNGNRFCDDSEPTATLTKTHQVGPARVVALDFQGTGGTSGTGNLNDCRSGLQFKNNFVGDTDTLVACTFDNTFANTTAPNSPTNPYPGNPVQTTDTHLSWSIVGNQAQNGAGVSFTSTPPSSTGPDGTTTAQIHADAPSFNTICVTLRSNTTNNPVPLTGNEPTNGQYSCVEKDVRQNPSSTPPPTTNPPPTTTPPPHRGAKHVATNVSIRYDGNASGGTFKGQVSSAKRKCKVRTIKLFRNGHKIKTTKSARTGNWAALDPNAHGRFYVKATKKIYFNRTGRKIVCLSDKSTTIKV